MGLIINLFVIRLFILCFFYYVDAGEKSISKRKRGDCSVSGKKNIRGRRKILVKKLKKMFYLRML